MENNIYQRQIVGFGVTRGQALSWASSKSQGISVLIVQSIFLYREIKCFSPMARLQSNSLNLAMTNEDST